MKFDMSAAWNEAMRLVGANKDVLFVIAGVFFFLPNVAFMLLFAGDMAAIEATQAANPDPEAVGAAMMAFYASVWWVLLLVALVQGVGMLGLLTLLSDRARPTVGQALATGAKLLLPYIAAQVIITFLLAAIFVVPFAIGAAAGAVTGILVGIVAVAVLAYVFTKLMLVSPVIAIERVTNPFAAIARSWRLTKGNSLRLFFFVFLIGVALIVVGSVLGMIVGVVFAFGGPESALIGQSLVSSLVNALFVTLLLAVLAAIHRQLTGGSPETISETFS